MTGLSPTAVIDNGPEGWKSLIVLVFARHVWPSLTTVTSDEEPAEYANTVPERDTVTTPSLRSLATASSAAKEMEAGSPALPTHRRPAAGSRTASTEPPCTWVAPSGRVTAWPIEKEVGLTGDTVRVTVSPSVTSPPA